MDDRGEIWLMTSEPQVFVNRAGAANYGRRHAQPKCINQPHGAMFLRCTASPLCCERIHFGPAGAWRPAGIFLWLQCL